MMRTSARLALALTLATGLVAAPAAAAEELVVDSVDLSALPQVSLVITLPASMAGSRPSAEDFALLVGGERPKLDVFAAVSEPLDVVLLLDTSGSMFGDPIEQARSAATEFVDAMPGTASITVIAFGEAVTATTGQDDGTAAIMSLEASGETALYDAVVAGAAAFQPDVATRRVMIILSDGGDTMSTASLDDAVAAARSSNAELHAVALATSEADRDSLAAITEGPVLTATDAGELSDRYSEIAVGLTGQYRLTFATPAAGSTQITVLLNGPAGVASTTISIDLPEPGTIAITRSTVVGPTATSLDAGVSVTIAAPGALGRPWVLPVGIALVFLGAVVTLSLTLRQRDERPPSIETLREEPVSQSGPIAAMAGRLRSLGDRFAQRRTNSSIDMSLDRAGVNLRPGEFVVVAATGIVVLTLAGITLAGVPGAVIFGGAAGFAPRTILQALTERRRRSFGDQLEGTLQIIAGSLRAGYGLTQAIATVAEESPTPTSQEFSRVVVENRLGRTIEQSMASLATRMNNEDLGWVVEAIQIQHEVGGNLAEVLDTVTSTIRDRNQIKRQVKALSAEGRISAYILLALPFVIAGFIATISPDYLSELTQTTVGRIMLGVAALLMAAGAGWIKKIVRVDF